MKSRKIIIEGKEKEIIWQRPNVSDLSVQENRVIVFSNDKTEFEFTVSLAPTGNDEELPGYILYPYDQTVPEWVMEHMPQISEWIMETVKEKTPGAKDILF